MTDTVCLSLVTRQPAMDGTGSKGGRILHLASQAQQHAAFLRNRAEYWREQDRLDWALPMEADAAFLYRQARILMGIEQ